jgi:hypothetical protein
MHSGGTLSLLGIHVAFRRVIIAIFPEPENDPFGVDIYL